MMVSGGASRAPAPPPAPAPAPPPPPPAPCLPARAACAPPSRPARPIPARALPSRPHGAPIPAAPPSPGALRVPIPDFKTPSPACAPLSPEHRRPAWGPGRLLPGTDGSWALPGHRVLDGHERAAGPIPQLHPPALAGRGPRLPLQLWSVSPRRVGQTRDHTCGGATRMRGSPKPRLWATLGRCGKDCPVPSSPGLAPGDWPTGFQEWGSMTKSVRTPQNAFRERAHQGDGQNGPRASCSGAWRPGELQPSPVAQEAPGKRPGPQSIPPFP